MRKIYFTLVFLSLVSLAYGQKYSNEFLGIGVGARGHGMGQAQVAQVGDVTAGFWNPAGLMQVKDDFQFSFMHAEWFGGIGKYDYLSAVYPLSDSLRTVGFSFIRFGVDNIPNTLSLYGDDGSINYSNITNFTAGDYALIFSYAQKLPVENLTIGGNAKIIHRKVGPFANAWGFGLDVGLQYRVKDWRFGATVKDLTSTFNAWKFNFTEEEKEVLQITNNEIPINSLEITKPRIILGAGYAYRAKKFGLYSEIDLTATTDGRRNVLLSANPISIDPSIGIEMDYNNIVFLRGGLSNFQRYTDLEGNKSLKLQPSAGVGFEVFNIQIDYALNNIGFESGNAYSHVVSLIAKIDFDFYAGRKESGNISRF